MSNFKVGDIVRHKATGNFGPNMSVKTITGPTVICTYWHDVEKVFKRSEFAQEELEAASANRDISVH